MKKRRQYLPIMGIEVHIELKTKSKMFCACSANHFQVKANTHTCPTCLGLPGALPVPNKKAIEWCILIGMALNCKINKFSRFDRKNYFYPDLAKGYQISQYDRPFCQNGRLKIQKDQSFDNSIRINRVHMEEDTGKLIHKEIEGKKYSLIDFNRSGVPLVEIVTEADFHTSEQVILYLKKLQRIIRYLGVSDADMEKGSMRCEVNVSLKKLQNSKDPKLPKLPKLPNYKVEVKNINSFRFVKKAIEYEIKRQKKILLNGKTPFQETRGFDEKTNKTFSQRSKEDSCQYRYFPEPDIPPIRLSQKWINKIKSFLPELADTKIARFQKDYGLSFYNADILTQNKKQADYIDELAKHLKRISHKNWKIELDKISKMIVNKKVNINKFNPLNLIKNLQKKQQNKLTDVVNLTELIKEVFRENEKAVNDYKKGKKETVGFLIGQVMNKTKGKADAQTVQMIIVKKLRTS